jgi:hypothetical protein
MRKHDRNLVFKKNIGYKYLGFGKVQFGEMKKTNFTTLSPADLKTLENHQQSAHLEDTYNYFHSESSSEMCQFCMAPCTSKANFYQHVSTYHQVTGSPSLAGSPSLSFLGSFS